MRCDRCELEAVVDQPYRQAHLCKSHFLASVEGRVRRELHRQLPGFPGGTVAVALSGGKDSVVTLELASRYFSRRPGVRLVAITVDEGIADYRTASLRAAAACAERLEIEHRIVRSEDALGTTTDAAALELPMLAPCSFCGVWRRQLLNQSARDVGADVLLLGFNLDDLAQTVLMNLARGELPRLLRMAPHTRRQPGLIPRAAPLAAIPEREVYLYARLAALQFDHSECPHATRAARNEFREVLWRLEDAIPGTRQALLRTRERLLPLLETAYGGTRAGVCSECGEPATGTLCRACSYRTRARTATRPAATARAPRGFEHSLEVGDSAE
ncbi:MAG: TIGR00269 family protein [Thermoplasmata archaeon]|nr:TIGR00269 family protein [Thermoplasmata archaeon]